MEKYKNKHGKKYFNWGCVNQLLSAMDTKAQKVKDPQLQTAAKDTSQASKVYISTGSAGTDWIKAWASASPDKLFNYVRNNYDGSVQSAIQHITQYLQKYCRLAS